MNNIINNSTTNPYFLFDDYISSHIILYYMTTIFILLLKLKFYFLTYLFSLIFLYVEINFSEKSSSSTNPLSNKNSLIISTDSNLQSL